MNMIFRTTDNCTKPLGELLNKNAPPEISQSVFRDLQKIANAPLKELCGKNQSLLVFPKDLGEHDDGIEDLPIFTMYGSEEKAGDAKITTGNLMGFVGVNGTQVEITSRFSPGGEDFFLHYMLAKVFALNLFDLKHLSGDGQFDFLIYLFPYFLQKALSQGMFRTYQFFARNDANIKGALDTSRHIKQNVPFAGKIAYNSRERSFDNCMTQLVRHTIEEIKNRPDGKAVLSRNEDIRRAAEQIVIATPSYKTQERERIIAGNAKPFAHPFFIQWRPLQKLCLAILNSQRLKYGASKNQIYGILFDGAWLWEEYLASILKGAGFTHAENKKRSGGLRMFSDDCDEENFDKNHRRIYPDFYKPDKFVLDAKYKQLSDGVGREDLYQIVTYMHTMKIEEGGFLYPEKEAAKSARYKLAGYGGTVHVIGMKIPQDICTQKEFVKKMEAEEKKLLCTFSQ